MVRIWDLNSGAMLMELEGRGDAVRRMALSRDGKLVAGIVNNGGYVITCHGDTGRLLGHTTNACVSLDFSPDGATLATGSDRMIELWSTATWQLQGTIDCCGCNVSTSSHVYVQSILYSPSGELLAVGAGHIVNDQTVTQWNSRIYICNPVTKECIANIEHVSSASVSLVWTPDSTRLLSDNGSTIREWDSSTWKQIGDIWKGSYARSPPTLAVKYDGTIVASLTTNNHVRLWSLSDRRTIAIFQNSDFPHCITFSTDGKHIFMGGKDKKISQWAVPEHAWPKDTPKDRVIFQGQGSEANALVSTTDSDTQGFDETEIPVMNTTVRNACISGELTTAEELLTQEITVNGNNCHSYANRSVVMARKLEWDSALEDATKSLSIQPSLVGYISKGIALCGKKRVRDAKNAFDLASTFINGGSKMIHSLFMIKSIALFSANQHAEAMDRVRELASTCSNADTVLACRTLEVYLHIQLGNNALDRASPTEAADHFTAAVNTGTFLSKSAHHSKYEELVVFFGCDFTSLWQTANQRRCHALLRAGKPLELSTFQKNARNADATPEITMCRSDDDGKDSISDIYSDIDDIEDVCSVLTS